MDKADILREDDKVTADWIEAKLRAGGATRYTETDSRRIRLFFIVFFSALLLVGLAGCSCSGRSDAISATLCADNDGYQENR